MGQKFKDFMSKKNTEFVVEDQDDDNSESVALSSFPDFDPSKFDSDSNIISETTERRLLKLASSNTKSDSESDQVFPQNTNLKLSFDSKSRQHVSINESKKFTFQKKSKNFKNRSSEFSKNELKMADPAMIHRHSNDLYRYKNKGQIGEHRRLYGSGFGLSSMEKKLKENTLSANESLKESMTRKKITAYKVTSKNSNQDSGYASIDNIFRATRPLNVNSSKSKSKSIKT